MVVAVVVEDVSRLVCTSCTAAAAAAAAAATAAAACPLLRPPHSSHSLPSPPNPSLLPPPLFPPPISHIMPPSSLPLPPPRAASPYWSACLARVSKSGSSRRSRRRMRRMPLSQRSEDSVNQSGGHPVSLYIGFHTFSYSVVNVKYVKDPTLTYEVVQKDAFYSTRVA